MECRRSSTTTGALAVADVSCHRTEVGQIISFEATGSDTLVRWGYDATMPEAIRGRRQQYKCRDEGQQSNSAGGVVDIGRPMQVGHSSCDVFELAAPSCAALLTV